jgi:hypothetical protein
MSVGLMAKKRTGPGAGKAPDQRRVIASLKGSDEFEAWFAELGHFLRLPKTTLIEHALVEFARAKGFKKLPPER